MTSMIEPIHRLLAALVATAMLAVAIFALDMVVSQMHERFARAESPAPPAPRCCSGAVRMIAPLA